MRICVITQLNFTDNVQLTILLLIFIVAKHILSLNWTVASILSLQECRTTSTETVYCGHTDLRLYGSAMRTLTEICVECVST